MTREIRQLRRSVVATIFVVVSSSIFMPNVVAAIDDAPTIEVKKANVKAAGISLEYPRTWTVVVLTPSEVRAARRATVKRNPKLGTLIDEAAQAQAAKNTQFAAADVDAALAGGVSSIVDVRSGSGFELPLDQMVDAITTQLEKAGATVLARSPVRVNGSRALRVDSRLEATAINGAPMALRISQLLATVHGRSVVVTIATSDDPKGAATIDRVLGSVRAI